MITMKKLFITLILSLTLVGCATGGTLLQKAELATTVANVGPLLKRTTSLAESNWTSFTPEEQVALKEAYDRIYGTYERTKMTFESGKLDDIILDLAYLESTYYGVRMGYAQAREIIIAHWDDFPSITQMELKRIDLRFQNMDKTIISTLESGNENETVNQIRSTLLMAAELVQVYRLNQTLRTYGDAPEES